jgi:serine/threonine-protein kinase
MIAGEEIGPYRVLERIGSGGMGEVWLAQHTALGRRVAVKVLRSEHSHRDDAVARFFNEAKAAAAIADPGIVQVFDFGEHTDGSVYLAMEVLDGEPLDARLDRLGQLPVAAALRILRQVATTLAAAHAAGIIHRDIKPANIFLVRDAEVAGGERAKLLDFGIAKLAPATSTIETGTGAMMGTPTYMSPEQCRGAGQVDARTDIYSCGCVLFELLAGNPPFVATGVGELIAMHLREAAPALDALRPDVPPAVAALVARCLAKDADERFATATALADAIVDAGGAASTPLPFTATSRPPGGAVVSVTTLGSSSISVDTPAPVRHRGRWLGAVAGAAIAVGAGIAAWHFVVGDAAAPDTVPSVVAVPVAHAETKLDQKPEEVVVELHPDERIVQTRKRIAVAALAFKEWAKRNPNAGCPRPSVVAATSDDHDVLRDAWGATMELTCADQPETQIVGILSAGSDGEFGTDDDIASWTLPDVAATIAGPRWRPALVSLPRPRPQTSTSTDSDIPDHR